VRPLPHLILISSLAGFIATTCSAAIITAIGENSTNAAKWRTASTAKGINPANNNIYGNDGYVMFATEAVNSSVGGQATGINPFTFSGTLGGPPATTLNVMPTYVSSFTQASGFTNVSNMNTNVNFDNPAGGSLRSGVGYEGAGILGVTNQPIFSFTVNSNVPAAFTVGLFFTTSNGTVTGAGIMGGGVTTPVTITRSSTSILSALFFRISGAASGDSYTVVVSGGGGALDPNIDIMGITFDSTPEPSTLAGCAAASLVLIWLSRRRKKLSSYCEC
jgi:hypothetical protein